MYDLNHIDDNLRIIHILTNLPQTSDTKKYLKLYQSC